MHRFPYVLRIYAEGMQDMCPADAVIPLTSIDIPDEERPEPLRGLTHKFKCVTPPTDEEHAKYFETLTEEQQRAAADELVASPEDAAHIARRYVMMPDTVTLLIANRTLEVIHQSRKESR